jgi:large subunit ribosomal protein LP0
MSGGDNAGKAKKQKYFGKLVNLLEEYPAILVVGADNVGSNHMQAIRKSLRAKGAVLLMGKNTMIRKAIRGHMQSNPSVEQLLPMVKGNIGFVFCKGDLSEIKKILVNARVRFALFLFD